MKERLIREEKLGCRKNAVGGEDRQVDCVSKQFDVSVCRELPRAGVGPRLYY